MNFDKLFARIAAIVIGVSAIGKLDAFQRWIWIQQAKVISESRTANSGSPRFFISILLQKNRAQIVSTRIKSVLRISREQKRRVPQSTE